MYTCKHVQKKLYVVWFCVATPEQFSVALAWLTSFCLTLPQLFLPAGLRQGNCRKLTTWIGKATTCRAHSVVRFRKTNKKLDSDFSDANFEFDGWIFFDWSCDLVQRLFLSHIDTMFLDIFLLVLGLFAEKSSLESLESLLGLDSWALFFRPLVHYWNTQTDSLDTPSDNCHCWWLFACHARMCGKVSGVIPHLLLFFFFFKQRLAHAHKFYY